MPKETYVMPKETYGFGYEAILYPHISYTEHTKVRVYIHRTQNTEKNTEHRKVRVYVQ